jgi:hypothetical protein
VPYVWFFILILIYSESFILKRKSMDNWGGGGGS